MCFPVVCVYVSEFIHVEFQKKHLLNVYILCTLSNY